MTVDEQIRDALTAEPLGAGPSAADRAAVELAAVGVRRRRTAGRAAVGVLAAAFVVVVAIVVWPRPMPEVRTGVAGSPEAVGNGDLPDGWTTMVEPTLRWTIAFPEGWTARSVEDQCRIGESSTIVSSTGEPPPYRERTNGCTTERNWNDVPRDAVLIGVSHRSPRFGPVPGSSPPLANTLFPLSVPPESDFAPQGDGGSYLSHAGQRVVVDGDDGYVVTVWIGEEASDEARADIHRAIALLRPPSGGSPFATTTTTMDPTWRTVALPSVQPLAPGEPGPGALLSGTLHREGDCLFVDGAGGQRSLVVWSGTDVHMVIDGDDQLVDLVVDGRSWRPLDQLMQVGGGYYPPSSSPRPVQNLRDECLTAEVFISN
jgi:hypothetical protein